MSIFIFLIIYSSIISMMSIISIFFINFFLMEGFHRFLRSRLSCTQTKQGGQLSWGHYFLHLNLLGRFRIFRDQLPSPGVYSLARFKILNPSFSLAGFWNVWHPSSDVWPLRSPQASISVSSSVFSGSSSCLLPVTSSQLNLFSFFPHPLLPSSLFSHSLSTVETSLHSLCLLFPFSHLFSFPVHVILLYK